MFLPKRRHKVIILSYEKQLKIKIKLSSGHADNSVLLLFLTLISRWCGGQTSFVDGLISFIDIDPEEARILSEINSSAHETLLPFLRNRFGSQCQLKLVVLAVGKATEVKVPRDRLDTYVVHEYIGYERG